MRRLLLAASAALLLAACSSGNLSNLDGTSWTFFGYDIGDGVVDVLPGTEPAVAFEGGMVSGSDGCNTFSGRFEVSAGNMIDIGTLSITTKSCDAEIDAQADFVLMVLDEAILFEKTSNQQLIIRTQDAKFIGYDEFQDAG